MFRQSFHLLLRQTFLSLSLPCSLDNIHYIDIIYALQALNCFPSSSSYQDHMTKENILRVTSLWERVSLKDQVVVTVGDIAELVLGQNQQYDWILQKIKQKLAIRGKRERRKIGLGITLCKERSRRNNTQSINVDENKENVDTNFGNVYVRKRVDKICSQFKEKVNRKESERGRMGKLGMVFGERRF